MRILGYAVIVGLFAVFSACAENRDLETFETTGQSADEFALSSFPGTPSNLSKSLSGSLIGNPSGGGDADHDGLIDNLENSLADQFRPYIFFDSNERARTPNEPYTFFQVRPVDLMNTTKVVRIKYVFAFELDGGYGPASFFCSDAHPGDLEDVTFRVVSTDGVTWTLDSVQTWGPVSWSRHQDRELFVSGNDLEEPGHPIMFLSASKHHQHLSTAGDDEASPYSDFSCGENVNGAGTKVLVDLQSIGSPAGPFNNIGEPESHPESSFVDQLAIEGFPIFRVCRAFYSDFPGQQPPTWHENVPPSVASGQPGFSCDDTKIYRAWFDNVYTVGSVGSKALRNLMVAPVDVSLTDFTHKDFPPMWCMDGMLVDGFECAGDYCAAVALNCTTTRDRVISRSFTPYFSEESPSQQICSGGFATGVQCRGDNCDDLRLQCVTLEGVTPVNCQWTQAISEEQGKIDFGGESTSANFLAGIRCSGDYCDNLSFFVCQRSTLGANVQPSLTTSTTLPTSEEYQPVYCGDGQLVSGVFCRGDYCDNIGFKCTQVPGVTSQSGSWTPYFSEEAPSSRTCTNGFAVGVRCNDDFCDNVSLLCTELANVTPQGCTWTTATFSEEQRDLDFPAGSFLAGVQCFGDYCDNKRFLLCNVGTGGGGGTTPLPSDTPTDVTLQPNQPRTFFADNWPSKGNPYWTANVILSVNSLSGIPIPPGTVTVNGVAHSIGGGNLYYQEIDIPNSGPYTITISVTLAVTLQIKLGNR